MTRSTSGPGMDTGVIRMTDFERGRVKGASACAVGFSATRCLSRRRFVPRTLPVEREAPVHLAIADGSDLKSPLWRSIQSSSSALTVQHARTQVT